ncbi:MAG TPA: LytTR family DNA-binding domain-containing protein [Chitinophagaceae bacterium]|jgi:DNA-binding LytR/AlgR family response regulator
MQSFFFLRHNGKYMKIHFHEIVFVESCKNYVRIVTTSQTWLALLPIKQLEEHLPPELFCRVHRSYIVAIEHVMAFDHTTVYLKDVLIPVGDHYKGRLQNSVIILAGESRSKMTVSEAGIECLLEKE